MADETFEKVNDYTLCASTELGHNAAWAHKITRLFNFRAAQVTTVYREWISNSNGSTVTSQMVMQNFGDVESQDEIRAMREKLVELGGNPPPFGAELGKSRALNLGRGS
jgi:hypothetical protein